MKRILLLMIFLLPNVIFAQSIKSFSDDPATFADQVEQLFSSSKKEEAKITASTLADNITSGKLDADATQSIIKLGNEMLGKKYRAFPHMHNYISAINQMVAADAISTQFDEWYPIVSKSVAESRPGNYKMFDGIIQFSNQYWADKSIYKGKKHYWLMDAEDMQLAVEEGAIKVTFSEGNLFLYGVKDTSVIKNTKGVYYPLTNKWAGDAGTVNWERCGQSEQEIKCELATYEIDLKKPEYSAKGATLYCEQYFDNKAVKGNFSDKLSVPIKGEYQFPKFASNEQNLNMDKLLPSIKFNGNIEISGTKIAGKAQEGERLCINFYDQSEQLTMKAFSSGYYVKNASELFVKNAMVSLYLAQDSIFHPNADIAFNTDSRELRVVRGENASAQIAFLDSYHKVELDVDGVFWDMNTDDLEFKMVGIGRTPVQVPIESANYYSKEKTERYKLSSNYDHVQYLYNWWESTESPHLTDQDFATMLKGSYDKESVRLVLYELVKDGFITYEPNAGNIQIRQKVRDNILAKNKKVDYDNMRFVSYTPNENATISLKDQSMKINGVQKVIMSDSQKVMFKPGGKLNMRAGRDIDFEGGMVVGWMEFGKGVYDFSYDDYKLEIDSADNLIFKDFRKDRSKGELTPIRHVSGTIFIDDPNNKSGLANDPTYPKFVSKGNSIIYYNNDDIMNGAYKGQDFYYSLDPFEMTGVDNMTPDKFVFDGKMVCGNILPELRSQTRLGEDLTLKFDKDVENVPVYGGMGDLSGTVKVGTEGLRAAGDMKYLTAMINSDDYLFLPDSSLIKANSILIEEGQNGQAAFPHVRNQDLDITWFPQNEVMQLKMKENPFVMYNERLRLNGNMTLASRGLMGEGKLEWENLTFTAEHYDFNPYTMVSNSCSTLIKTYGGEEVFNAEEMKAVATIDENKVSFESTTEEHISELPFNAFQTNATTYDWDLAKNILGFSNENGQLQEFTALDTEMKELTFQGETASLDVSAKEVAIQGVPNIKVADASVTPFEGAVLLKQGGEIELLEDAIIDFNNEAHKIVDADVYIRSKEAYEASGQYVYSVEGMEEQMVFLDEIEVEVETTGKKKEAVTTTNSKGKGQIEEDQNFHISEQMTYKGNFGFQNNSDELELEGFAKVDVSSSLKTDWFRVEDQMAAGNTTYEIASPKNEENESLMIGIGYDTENRELYTAFLSKPEANHQTVFQSEGQMQLDSKTYSVGATEVIKEENVNGDLFVLNDKDQRVTAKGQFNLGGDMGSMEVKTGGELLNDLKDNTYVFNEMAMSLDFFFDKKLYEDMTANIKSLASENPEIDFTTPELSAAIAQIMPEKDLNETLAALESYESLQLPKGFEKSMILTNVKMMWSPAQSAFVAQGPFGISHMGETKINRMLDGYIEVGSRKTGNFINLYIELADEDGKKEWYYINYKNTNTGGQSNGLMQVVSSDLGFNNKISEIKEQKRTQVQKQAMQSFQYKVATPNAKNNFVARMQGENAELTR